MLNAIIDYVNDRTEATERAIYRALRVVLRHCIAMCDEIEQLRYPRPSFIIESTPRTPEQQAEFDLFWGKHIAPTHLYVVPGGWDKIESGEQQ